MKDLLVKLYKEEVQSNAETKVLLYEVINELLKRIKELKNDRL